MLEVPELIAEVVVTVTMPVPAPEMALRRILALDELTSRLVLTELLNELS